MNLKKLSEYIGINHTIVVSNGTAALHLALLAFDIKPEEEIIVPAYTFPASSKCGGAYRSKACIC